MRNESNSEWGAGILDFGLLIWDWGEGMEELRGTS